jgi:anthranilate synthase component I
MLLKNGNIYIQAGAGIVHDSVPALEYQESLNKAGAMFQAVQLASGNFIIKNGRP